MQERGNSYLISVAGGRGGHDSSRAVESKKDKGFNPENKKASRPTVPCDGPRMNPSVDVGNPPRPFRHLRMAERRSPDPSSSRVPVHSALVQKSVTVITNPAGRLSIWMLGKSRALGKGKSAKSWQAACYQSNAEFTNGTCQLAGTTLPAQEVEVLRDSVQFCMPAGAFDRGDREGNTRRTRRLLSPAWTTKVLDSARSVGHLLLSFFGPITGPR